jgi:hypothetical protein|nr:MAG TPA: hypothetical protein [Caudoviricetes sp.]
MNNTELIERLVELERSMVERRDVDVKAFKEKQRQELVDYELKKTWESNGYSQALVDVRNILRGESQNDEGVEDDAH